MKCITNFFLLLILPLAMILPSCDDDDNGTGYVLEMVKKTYSHEIYISGEKDVEVYKNVTPIALSNIVGEQISNMLSRAELISYNFQISGLKDMESKPSLEKISLFLHGKESDPKDFHDPQLGYPKWEYKIGTCAVSPSSGEFASDKAISNDTSMESFISKLMYYYGNSHKSPKLDIQYTPTENIEHADNVTMIINFTATYYYWREK